MPIRLMIVRLTTLMTQLRRLSRPRRCGVFLQALGQAVRADSFPYFPAMDENLAARLEAQSHFSTANLQHRNLKHALEAAGFRAICCFILGKVGRPSFLDLRRIAFPSVKQQIALGFR